MLGFEASEDQFRLQFYGKQRGTASFMKTDLETASGTQSWHIRSVQGSEQKCVPVITGCPNMNKLIFFTILKGKRVNIVTSWDDCQTECREIGPFI